MIKTQDRKINRLRRHRRVRVRLAGTSERPRLAVFRSLNHLYAQLIDDTASRTVAAASTVELKAKGTPLHAATVVGDTVGDPFKDTSSVAMNPVIKFTTLFGLLAVELAVSLASKNSTLTHVLALAFFLVSFFFVHRSFYGMRIGSDAKK